jgi:hypothetical protein
MAVLTHPERLLFLDDAVVKECPGIGKVSLEEVKTYRAKFGDTAHEARRPICGAQSRPPRAYKGRAAFGPPFVIFDVGRSCVYTSGSISERPTHLALDRGHS